MRYIIHYDIAALFVSVTIFLHFYFKKTINTRQNIAFAALILLAIFSNIADLFTMFTISYPGTIPQWLDCIINVIYLATFNATAMVYFLYIVIVTKDKKISKLNQFRIAIPYAIIVILILTTPLTKLVFYYDENGIYTHGSCMILLYVSALYYVISSMIQTIIYHKRMTQSQIITVLFFTISSLGAIAIQMMHESFLIVQFMVSISVLLIYLSLENPEDYMDKLLGTFNNIAFMEVFEKNVTRERKFSVLGIQIDGLKYINENLGVIAGNKLMKEIADFILSLDSGKKVYHMSGATFAVMGILPDEKWKEMMTAVHDRFAKPFMYGEMDISLTAYMCMLTYPDTVNKLEDAIDMIEYSLGQAKASGNGEVIYADKEILEKGKRENKILQMVKQAIRENSFEVFYQPIYSVKEKRFTTAEALVRLKNGELGYVSPEEFIPIAEKNGLILNIGEKVIKKVCTFYQEKELDKYGIENVHVNLSVVECMQESLHEKFLETMSEFGVELGRISLEITETAAVASKEVLRHNMDELIKHGIRFSMDDYGTGFSNTATIINYPFSEIKIDKSIVWSAMKNQKAMIALRHSVAMIKNLNFDIVAEGVETEEQALILEDMGCDYFQGYFYSKPLDEVAFFEKIS